MSYDIKGIFEKSAGKFSIVFGNAAIIDCNWVFLQVVDAAVAYLKNYEDYIDPETFLEILGVIELIQ